MPFAPTDEVLFSLTPEQKEMADVYKQKLLERLYERDRLEAERHKEVPTPPTPFTTRMKELLFTGTDFYGAPTSLLGRTISSLRTLFSDVLHAAQHDLRKMALPDKRPRLPSFSGMEELPAIVLLSATILDAPDTSVTFERLNWGTPAPSSPPGATESLDLHQGNTIYEVAVSPDGTQALTASRDGTARIFDLQTGTLLHTLSGHNKPVTSAVWTTSAILTGANDQTIRFFDPETGIQTRSLSFPGNLDWMSASSDAQILALSLDETVQIIDTHTDTRMNLPNGSYRGIVSPDGSTLAYLMPGNTLVLQDRISGSMQRFPTSSRMHILSFSPDGQKLAAGGSGDVQLFDLQTNTSHSLSTHTGAIWRLTFSQDNAHLIVSDNQGLITVSDLDESGVHPTSTRFTTGHPTGTALTPDQSVLLAFVQSNPSRLYAFPTPESLWIRPTPAPVITPIEEEILVTDAMVESLLATPEPSTPTNLSAPSPDPSPDLLAETITSLALQTQSSSSTALREETLALPALERQWREQDRRISSLTTEITSQQSKVTQAQTQADRDQSHIQNIERLLSQARNQGRRGRSRASMLERDLHFARQNAHTSSQILSEARQSLTRLQEAQSQAHTSKDTLETQMDSVRSSRDSYVTQFIAASTLLGESEEEATTTAHTLLTAAFQQATDALPHVRANATILDLTLAHTDLPASWIDPIREIREHPGVVLGNSGGLVQILGRITNLGDREGPVTLYFRGESDLVSNPAIQQTLTTTLRPGESRDFITTIRIPQSHTRPGSVSITTTSPDEPDGIYTKGTKAPRTPEDPTKTPEENKEDRRTAATLHTLRVIAESPGGTGSTSDRIQRYLAANPVTGMAALEQIRSGSTALPPATAEMILAAAPSLTPTPQDIVLHEAVSTTDSVFHMREALVAAAGEMMVGDSSIEGGNEIGGLWSFLRKKVESEGAEAQWRILDSLGFHSEGQLSMPFANQHVRVDTQAGRTLLGIAPLLRDYQNAPWSLIKICVQIEKVFGIDATRLFALARHATDARFEEGMVSLFEQAGFDVTKAPLNDRTLPVTFLYNGSTMRVVANPSGFKKFDHARINVTMDGITTENAVRWEEGVFFVDIPSSLFKGSMDPQVKVIAWFEGEGDATTLFAHETIDVSRLSFKEEVELSVDGDLVEKEILRQVAKNPPLDNISQWRWDIGSGAHKSSEHDHAFNAVDLNLGSGNADLGQPVKAVADGVVYKNFIDGKGNTTLILRHEHDMNGDGIKETIWYSEYLHIRKVGFVNGDPLPEFSINVEVQAGDVIAEVANVSQLNDMYAHLHFRVMDADFRSVDLRMLITGETGFKIANVTATDGGADGNSNSSSDNATRSVTWNEDLGAWVNVQEKLIYDRSAQSRGIADASWIAWSEDPMQRVRVVWIHKLKDGRVVDAWLTQDQSRKWNSNIQAWDVP